MTDINSTAINSTAITAATTFQERMFERVRESLSELLTPEEAKALVDRAIEESLFKRELVTPKNYHDKPYYKASRFEELVKETTEPILRAAIADWLAEHHEEVKTSIQEIIEQGIAATVVKVFQASKIRRAHV